jgi:hypothetical protein
VNLYSFSRVVEKRTFSALPDFRGRPRASQGCTCHGHGPIFKTMFPGRAKRAFMRARRQKIKAAVKVEKWCRKHGGYSKHDRINRYNQAHDIYTPPQRVRLVQFILPELAPQIHFNQGRATRSDPVDALMFCLEYLKRKA